MSTCSIFSCVVGRGCFLWPVGSLGKTVSLCPASFCTPRPNLPVTPGVSWLPTFVFQSPIMKRTSFLDALAVTDHAEALQWGTTPHPRSGGVVERSYPTSKERWQRGRRRTERSYSTFKVRRGGCEEIPSSKVRSSGCALLEQPWRDTPRPR